MTSVDESGHWLEGEAEVNVWNVWEFGVSKRGKVLVARCVVGGSFLSKIPAQMDRSVAAER